MGNEIQYEKSPQVYSNVFRLPFANEDWPGGLVCRTCGEFFKFQELEGKKAKDGCPACGAIA